MFFFGIEGNVALNRNLEYNNLLLRLIPGDIYSASFYNMAVGTGGGAGGGGGNCPPPIFCQPKKFKSLKITTYKSVYSNKDKIGF